MALVLAPSLFAAEESKGVFSRPVVIGASLADGFNRDDMFGPGSQNLSFDLFLDKRILTEHDPIVNKGQVMFFSDPRKSAKTQLDFVLNYRPSVVFAPDYLFWLFYGVLDGKESTRLKMLEEGLQLLSKIEVPLVIGNIPDARKAAGRILSAEQMPKVETIATANELIAKWVSSRKATGLLDLSILMAALQGGQELEVHGELIAPERTSTFLQADQLHPTKEGTKIIALLALESLQKVAPFDNKQVDWNLKAPAEALEDGE